MTAQYWDRKIVGGYVFYQGKYRQVLQVQQDTDGHNLEYAEDYLPHLLFRIGDDDVRYEDFEIRFPEEKYVFIGNRIAFGKRTLKKAYRIVPDTTNLHISNENFRLNDWLNAKPFEFNKPEDLFKKKTCIFSDELAATTHPDSGNKTIHHCGQQLMTYYKDGGRHRMELYSRMLPDELNLWPDITDAGGREEVAPPHISRTGLHITNLRPTTSTYFSWTERVGGGGLDPWDYSFEYIHDNTILAMYSLCGGSVRRVFNCLRDIIQAEGISDRIKRDLAMIYNRELSRGFVE